MSAEPWSILDAELGEWAKAGRIASFWWRDDDAIEPTPELERLLDLSERHRAPIALAVIPANTGPALAERLAGAKTAFVLQHGFSHANHAPPGERATEFGPQRSIETRLAEIGEGWAKLAPFRSRTAIFVPPWNRFDRAIMPGLAGLGFRAVSTFGTRQAAAIPLEVNCHCDIIRWRSTRGFVGEAKALARLVEHLRFRRVSEATADEPTGLLTHHLQHDEACWRFVEDLLQRLERHEAARWITPHEALPA